MTSPFNDWCRAEEGVLLTCLVPGCGWSSLVQWGDFTKSENEPISDAAALFNAHYIEKHGA